VAHRDVAWREPERPHVANACTSWLKHASARAAVALVDVYQGY
jgi:hypothetical protein